MDLQQPTNCKSRTQEASQHSQADPQLSLWADDEVSLVNIISQHHAKLAVELPDSDGRCATWLDVSTRRRQVNIERFLCPMLHCTVADLLLLLLVCFILNLQLGFVSEESGLHDLRAHRTR
jgi:hypothetical protein